MSSGSVQKIVQRAAHARALLSGGLGVFASLLAIEWALFGYNLPSAVDVTSTQSQSLMLFEVCIASISSLASGLILAAYIGGDRNAKIHRYLVTYRLRAINCGSVVEVTRLRYLT